MGLVNAFKRNFLAGLILVAPLVVTVYVLRLLVGWSSTFINPVLENTRLVTYTANIEIVAQVVALLVIVAVVTVLGLVAQMRVGRYMFGNVGRVVGLLPLVRTIYFSVRQVVDSLVDRETAYESVVLVEYPRDGFYAIGFVTGEGHPDLEELTGQEVFSVYLPNSPNPTGGRLVLLPEEQIQEIDMSVRQGMRLIVTTGIGSEERPDDLPLVGDDEFTEDDAAT